MVGDGIAWYIMVLHGMTWHDIPSTPSHKTFSDSKSSDNLVVFQNGSKKYEMQTEQKKSRVDGCVCRFWGYNQVASKTITMGSRHFASFPHHLGSFPHQICFISPKKLLHLPNNMLHKIISYHIISPTDCFNFYKKILTSPTLFCVTIGKVSQKKMRKSLVIHQTGGATEVQYKTELWKIFQVYPLHCGKGPL